MNDGAGQRIAALDGLRGLAAMMVVVSHLSNQTKWLGGALGFGAGQVGVMIFFALSGYLMGALYLDRPFKLADVAGFAVRRIARVAPLYYAVVGVSFVGASMIPNRVLYAVDQTNIWQHLALISGIEVLWTIPVEMQFYAAFVALWGIRASIGSGPLLLLCALLALAPIILLNGNSAWPLLFQCAGFFAAGIVVSRFLGAREDAKGASALAWNLAFVVGLTGTFLLYPRVGALAFNAPAIPTYAMWLSPAYLATVTALLATTVRAPIARSILGAAPMVFLGAISYAVYLLHAPIMRLIASTGALDEAPLLFFAATIGATLVVASIVHYAFERPARSGINQSFGSVSARK